MRIHIAFQEGFDGETVIVRLNNTGVYRRSGLKTRMQIGLADTFEYETEQQVTELQIDISAADRTSTKTIPIEATSYEIYIGISIDPDGNISCNTGHEPFRYA